MVPVATTVVEPKREVKAPPVPPRSVVSGAPQGNLVRIPFKGAAAAKPGGGGNPGRYNAVEQKERRKAPPITPRSVVSSTSQGNMVRIPHKRPPQQQQRQVVRVTPVKPFWKKRPQHGAYMPKRKGMAGDHAELKKHLSKKR